MLDLWWLPVCVWRRADEIWRPGGNAREVEKKKEVALLLEERRNKNIVFFFD